ncbi:hypothetical protein HNQ88_001275 [Aureibacter tunicatorum]|uniref:Uncharacterized protein n=1 Tax=Aureibacter tunicatorum TaxID=866807 RepID=A0AAE4BPS4_9BACT|nr:hypothetical protein [Aureibacter tunicatorum]BDD03332.1 hypothetical protein AUTU_08150 [Aureibacter tunicatorum]
MDKSKLSFRYCFIAFHLVTSTKKNFSALEIQRQIGHKRYEPIWAMMNKIRKAMERRDGLYTLEGEIEIDDTFFTMKSLEKEKGEPLKKR